MGDNNTAEAWKADLLGRKTEADFILNFLRNRSAERVSSKRASSYVLNLDGSWGEGKTFFLENFSMQLESEDHISVYVNAWKDDFADDPMIAVMSAIDSTLKKYLNTRGNLRKTWQKTKRAGVRIAITAASASAKKLGNKYLGEGFDEIQEIWNDDFSNATVLSEDKEKQVTAEASKIIDRFVDQKTELALKKFADEKVSIEKFKENLTIFLTKFQNDTGKKLPLFILIDELDRCRPLYAISTLERIKHFFDLHNVVFIVATDSEQLRHSVKAVYGQDFDSKRYLLRFFDRTYKFLKPDLKNFIRYQSAVAPINETKYVIPFLTLEDLLEKCAIGLNLSLRDLEQCHDHLRNVITSWDGKVPMQMIYLLSLIVTYHQGKSELFDLLASMSHTVEIQKYFRGVGTVYSRNARGERGNVVTEKASFDDALSSIISYAQSDLLKILNTDYSTDFKHKLAEPFNAEFSVIHGNTYSRSTKPPKSIIWVYSSYVKSAGQLITNPEGDS